MRHVQNLECAEVAQRVRPQAQVNYALIYLLFLILEIIKKRPKNHILINIICVYACYKHIIFHQITSSIKGRGCVCFDFRYTSFQIIRSNFSNLFGLTTSWDGIYLLFSLVHYPKQLFVLQILFKCRVRPKKCRAESKTFF